jgi:sugar/nucleoside kinase (ribokinase family)
MILDIGSISLDTTTTPFKTATEIMGGSATFFGLVASFFAETGLVGVVGDDYPEEYIRILEERLDTRGLVVEKGRSFRFESRFGYDLGVRTTLKTELNVFGDWSPVIPEEYADAEYVYIGNIGPEQQLRVLDQLNRPKITVADTIEYWMKNQREQLLELISRVDGMVLNDEEVRQLCETPNIVKGARAILEMGPDFVIIKKGEHGAILFTPEMIFPTCGYPLEEVVDPTGAGDCFAGGFMGHLARSGDLSRKTLREAVVYGNVMGSFAVERFGVERFLDLTMEEIEGRYRKYKSMVSF